MSAIEFVVPSVQHGPNTEALPSSNVHVTDPCVSQLLQPPGNRSSGHDEANHRAELYA